MAFSRDHFIRHRPYLYHFTSLANAKLLRCQREMLSAAAWVIEANQYKPQVDDANAFLAKARLDPVVLLVGPERIVTLNDQRPLRSSKSFAGLLGTYEDFIRCLKGLVFFWPGNEGGPSPKGSLAESFARRYANFACLRIPTADVWKKQEDPVVRFCTFNSGAPQLRDRLERGSHIFKPHSHQDLRASKVAEVVFTQRLDLPASTQYRQPTVVDWQPLFE